VSAYIPPEERMGHRLEEQLHREHMHRISEMEHSILVDRIKHAEQIVDQTWINQFLGDLVEQRELPLDEAVSNALGVSNFVRVRIKQELIDPLYADLSKKIVDDITGDMGSTVKEMTPLEVELAKTKWKKEQNDE